MVMNFGTSGGYKEAGLTVGSAVVASGAIFQQRLRSTSQKSFNWALYGGPVLRAPKIVAYLKETEAATEGIVASGINYGVSPVMDLISEQLNVAVIDMETASEAQILGQLG